MIYALWHGGSSYGVGSIPEDVETFGTVAEAELALIERARHGYWLRQSFNYADGRTESTFTPNADESPSMWVWFADPRDSLDPYPDRVIEIGDHGDVVNYAA